MFAKINHLAITTDYYAVNAKFYEALFGMKTSQSPRPESAVALGDGARKLDDVGPVDHRLVDAAVLLLESLGVGLRHAILPLDVVPGVYPDFEPLVAHAAQDAGQRARPKIIGDRQPQFAGELGGVHVPIGCVAQCQQLAGMSDQAFAGGGEAGAALAAPEQRLPAHLLQLADLLADRRLRPA